MQAKMRWRVFAFGGVSQNVEKPCVFLLISKLFFSNSLSFSVIVEYGRGAFGMRSASWAWRPSGGSFGTLGPIVVVWLFLWAARFLKDVCSGIQISALRPEL